jgi:hypothetical protein
MTLNFLNRWLRSPRADDRRHEPKNCGRCFAGASSYYVTYNTPYKHVLVLDRQEQIVERCGLVPELTEWCIRNNCIYGWTRIITNSERIDYVDHYSLFIATKDLNTYTLMKLTWA